MRFSRTVVRTAFGIASLAITSIGVSCVAAKKAVAPWKPGVAYPSPSKPVYRGFLDLKGLIHAHNIHSHDACDGNPNNQDTAAANTPVTLNTECMQQFRGDICQAQIDYVFMSDHGAQLDDTIMDPRTVDPMHPQALEGDNAMMWTQSLNDKLLLRNNVPVANETTCANGQKTLIIPGREGNNLMPIGVTQVEPTDTTLNYGIDTSTTTTSTLAQINATIGAAQSDGALVMIAHPEDMTEQQLASYNADGQEMYNLHNNALLYTPGFILVGTLLGDLAGGTVQNDPDNADLIFLGFFLENPDYLSRWAYVLSQGEKRVTTLGSDCHQNAIPQILSTTLKPTWDNMRGDRYQRVMRWFSNHLLVTPNADGSWDDTNLKAAVAAERLYGAFEVLGYPVGFDYHATVGSTVTEMGGDVQASASPELSVKLPSIENLDTTQPKPVFTVRILRADGENWDQVASGPGDLTFTPTLPGAYRAEVREIPYHLTAQLGPGAAPTYLSHDYVWIYSNAIYVH